MVQQIKVENVDLSLEEILANVGGELESVVSVQNDEDLDVVVLTNESWEHLLSLLDATQAEGYRIKDDLPDEILLEIAPDDSHDEVTGYRTDVPEKLHPAPDFELEAGEIQNSDDVLD
ncbi:hypothetical protein [Enterococcus dongliensis]|uniref:hypothetical protein n=1 Tax=Enterococcus dongliensis TaxID=2559925 RepID=UPI00288E18E5|nr:hypothetical protein [Enterococcus dongliensis]MDT2613292.1 hypothetical protein [Enterococcus dongliensis]